MFITFLCCNAFTLLISHESQGKCSARIMAMSKGLSLNIMILPKFQSMVKMILIYGMYMFEYVTDGLAMSKPVLMHVN